MKYTDMVINAVKDAHERQAQLAAQERALKAEYQAERISGNEYQQRKAELNERMQAIQTEVLQKIYAAATRYKQAVHKAAELDGSKIHEDAKLLQLDIKMTPQQFEALAAKHQDNPLMLQLLQEYSNKHEGMYADMVPTPTAKADNFDGFVRAAQNAIRTPDSLQAAMFVEGHYTPQYCTEGDGQD